MRTKASALNLMAAWVGQFAALVIQFVARIFFVKYLSAEYLGLSGLFSNILSMLCVAELGVGPAMSYSLYKPLAEKNIETVKSLMRLYRNTYRSIGSVILLMGILTIPVYPFFISGKPDIPNLDLIYFLFVFNTGVSYFYSYKRSLIACDQKKYIESIVHYAFYFGYNVLQIIILVTTQNYLAFLLCQIIANIVENFTLAKKADQMYPYLKEKNVLPIQQKELSEIKRNIGATIFHKFGSIIISGTDNLLISKFVSLAATGLYSNYFILINAVNTIFSQVFTAITASVGNLNVLEGKEKVNDIFNKAFFLNFWVYGFCAICLQTLLQPFVTLWLGENFLLDHFTVTVIVVNFYLTGMKRVLLSFRDATGTYYYDRYRPLVEAFINLVMSLILVHVCGITGVFLGTAISTLACIWVEPYVIYKYTLRTPLRFYWKKYCAYTAVVVFSSVLVSYISSLLNGNIYLAFAGKILLCMTVPNLIFFLVFHKTTECQYFMTFLKKFKKIRR